MAIIGNLKENINTIMKIEEMQQEENSNSEGITIANKKKMLNTKQENKELLDRLKSVVLDKSIIIQIESLEEC